MSSKPLMQCYARLPISFVRGEGIWLYDAEDNRYLDSFSGIAVTSLGHAHPIVTQTIKDRAEKPLHISNLFTIREQEQLAKKLCEISGLDSAFFANSGAEANETALKLCRLYGNKKNIDKPQIIVTEKSYHGRTLATLSASGNRLLQAGFEPLVTGFVRAPYNDAQAIESILAARRDIVAVMVEPVLGNGGVIIADDNYLSQIRAICDKYQVIMIVDEIQTGFCRTGTFFAYQAAKILPDIITVAKALANGLPISACIAKEEYASLFHHGKHGSTFGGNPFCCSVGLAVVNFMLEHQLWERASIAGKTLLAELKTHLKDIDSIVDIRGKGLMAAVELKNPCPNFREFALKEKLLVNITGDEKIIRILPALTISDAEIKLLVERLTSALKNFLAATKTYEMNSVN